MDFEHLRQFYRRPRELRALECLQFPEHYPGLAPWREHEIRVRFFQSPSFHPYRVWALKLAGETAQVRRVEWDHVADAQLRDALPDGPPTTYGADAELPIAAARQLLDDLAAVSLPPFLPVHTLGTDGVSFSIHFGSAWRSAKLSWWGDPPEPWRPLATLYDEAIALFEKFLPTSTARNPQMQFGCKSAG